MKNYLRTRLRAWLGIADAHELASKAHGTARVAFDGVNRIDVHMITHQDQLDSLERQLVDAHKRIDTHSEAASRCIDQIIERLNRLEGCETTVRGQIHSLCGAVFPVIRDEPLPNNIESLRLRVDDLQDYQKASEASLYRQMTVMAETILSAIKPAKKPRRAKAAK